MLLSAIKAAKTEMIVPYNDTTDCSAEEQNAGTLFQQTGALDTELLMEFQHTAALQGEGTLDLSCLEGKYKLLREIHGGGMSRIFLARHVSLGSEWIVKCIDLEHADLSNEAEILKRLNHISLEAFNEQETITT